MAKHTIKILWLFVFLSFAAAFQIVRGKAALSGPAVYLYSFIFLTGFLSWVYLTLRIFLFGRKLNMFVKRVMSNEYEAGIKQSRFCEDEVSDLSCCINKMADQLVRYDVLQRDRISVTMRALDIVYHTVKDGVIIFDTQKKEFRANPVVQAIFQVEQETMSYEAIALQSRNKEFMSLLQSALEKGALVTNVRVSLELPIRQTRRELMISIIPVKDINETVDLALIFVGAAGG